MLLDILCELERVMLHIRAFEESFPDMPARDREHTLIAANYLKLAALHLRLLPMQEKDS